MQSRQIEQLARLRTTELAGHAVPGRTRTTRHGTTRTRRPAPIRQRTGWALVWIGLRIAASTDR